jgi:hypothetical protein
MPYASISQPSVKITDIKEKEIKLSIVKDFESKVLTVSETDKGSALIESINLNLSSISDISEKYTFAASILPFRVQFKNVNYSGFGPNNVPPIGIAIIGVNNYIL